MRKYSAFKHSVLMISLLCATPFAAANWTIDKGVLLDPNGQPFIFRGVTIDHEFAPDKTVQAIKDAAGTGANAVQIEINTDKFQHPTSGERVKAIVQACKQSKVVCIFEPSTTAGYSIGRGSTPAGVFMYWLLPGISEAIAGQQDYIMLGFGNQAMVEQRSADYLRVMESYILAMRQYFPDFLIFVDGNNWGQDTDKAMQTFARQNQANGTHTQNLIYSVEMFDAYNTPEKIRDYITSFAQIGAPLVIGGFAPTHYYHPNYPTPTPVPLSPLPAASVMQYAQQYGVGYFAWNWSGSSNPGLNLTTNFDPLNLTDWGKLAFNDVNGIKATAKTATHFFNSSSSSISSSSSSSSVNPHAPVVTLAANVQYNGCGSVRGVASAEGSFDPDGDALTYFWDVSDGSYTEQFTSLNISFGIKPVTPYVVIVTVTDSTGLSTSKSTNLYHSYSDNCISSSSSSSSVIKPSSSSISSSSIKSSNSSINSSLIKSSSSSSSIAPKASCTYVINSQWGNGFTAAIRIKNNTAQTLSGWSVNWQYPDTTKVTSAWNAKLGGSNPYTANNDTWNANIQPGQTVEFGFQGSKPAGTAVVPVVTGGVCQ